MPHRRLTFAADPFTMTTLLGLRVLVVEDDALLRALLTEVLGMAGASVVAAGTGGQALALASAHEVDVVLSDLGLPDVPGDVLVRVLLERARRRPRVAIITGRTDASVAAALRDVGVDTVFVKPFDWPSLLEYLRTGRVAA